MKKYTSFLFDADGTILDTTELIIHCFKTTVKKFGKPEVPASEIKRYIGLPFVTQCSKYFGPLKDGEMNEIREFHRKYQVSVFRDYMKLFPGTLELFQYLKKSGRKTAIVTSRTRSTLDIYLDYFGLLEYIDAIVTPENVSKPKPDRESCDLAMEMLGSEAEETLFVGDAVFDEGCASAAEVDFALVKWTHQERHLFKNVAFEITDYPDFMTVLAGRKAASLTHPQINRTFL